MQGNPFYISRYYWKLIKTFGTVYEMSPGRALSRDSCPAKTTSAKARKIKNSTQNRL
jgi:hypothetical protein